MIQAFNTSAFSSVVTDEGQCCSFNIMPDYLMMNHDVAEVGTEISEVNE